MSPDDRVLLMKLEEPGEKFEFWITLGGGLEDGESADEALKRELREEIGTDGFAPGKVIWTRTSRFAWNAQKYEQDETYHLIKTNEFDAVQGEMDEEERAAFRGFRWWSVREIVESDETFAPRNLGALLTRLVAEGPPALPMDVGS
jgi:ADP-ribose pyrophosphatase YjhB (NUDIX family)